MLGLRSKRFKAPTTPATPRLAVYLAGLFLCPLVGLYIAFIRVNHAAGGGAGITENIRRKNHGGAEFLKRGARASVFLKIFAGIGTRRDDAGR